MARSPFGPLLAWWPPAKLGRRGPPEPDLPTLTVTDGVITPFSRDGVDYIEILWRQGGSFEVSSDVIWHNRALAAGGATGARTVSPNYVGGPGAAGGLIQILGSPLASGSYTVSIGAGGARITSGDGAGRNDGSNSVLTLPGGTTETANGGGGGGFYGTGMDAGGDGGSGGGGRGRSNMVSPSLPGSGIPGQGHDGGAGHTATSVEESASGGSGGSASAGGAASAGVPGTAGLGTLLDWIETPRTVCAGKPGLSQADAQVATDDEFWGNGSQAANNADVGQGGDGFLFLVVRADQVNVEMAA